MNRWLVAALLAASALLSGLAFGAPPEAQAEDGPVARLPREGDVAQYRLVKAKQLPDWTTPRTIGLDTVTMEWTKETRSLWDGQQHAFTGLGIFVGAPDREWPVSGVRTDLYTKLPGGRAISASSWQAHQNFTSARGTEAFTYVQDMALDTSECGGETGPRVVGRPATDALAVLAACPPLLESVTWSVSRGGWEERPPFGRVWTGVVEAVGTVPGSTAETRVTMNASFSPVLSLPVEQVVTTSTDADGGRATTETRLLMTGWASGEAPLPSDLVPFPQPPAVPLVAWGPHGPESGDLPEFPVRDARAALERDPDGAAFFDGHPDARVTSASYRARPYITGVDCARPRGPGFDELPLPPGPAEPRRLDITWSDASTAMRATFSAPGAAQGGPVHLFAAAVPTAKSMGTPELPLPDVPELGPSLAALSDAVPLITAMGGKGTLDIRVAPPQQLNHRYWYLSDEWAAARMPVGTKALTGMVFFSLCGATADEVFLEDTRGVVFVDGRLAFLWSGKIDYKASRAVVPQGLAAPPASVTGGSAPSGASPIALTLGGIALAGGGLLLLPAAARFAMSLFARFSPTQAAGHPLRRRILEMVRAEPGIALPAIVSALGVHRASAAHHVRMLQRLNLVRVTRTWRGLLVHAAGHAGVAKAGALARAQAPALLDAVRARPGIGVTELAAALGLSKGRVSVLVRDLERSGLLSTRREGRAVRLTLAA